jgi:hypothetical protein
VATILIAGVLLVFLLAFLVIAIDFAYIYVVRGELQNAADAAALAGAAMITDNNDLVQPDARAEAIAFAAKNKAAGKNVELLDSAIQVGFWNGSGLEEGVTPVNSVKVRVGRTGGEAVPLFFGRIVGRESMQVTRVAVAYRPPTPTTAMSLCIDTCDLVIPAGGQVMYFKEEQIPVDEFGVPKNELGVAWTEFSSLKSTNFGPNSLIAQYIRGDSHPPNVCGECITTNNAGPTQIMKVLLDEYNEQKDAEGKWKVVVPVLNSSASICGTTGISACPPGVQPEEPYLVERYAVANITGVTFNPTPTIRIAEIACTDCPATELLGIRAVLVK